MTIARGENVIVLERVKFIHHQVQFQKRGKKVTRLLIDFGSEINAMTLAYAK